MYSNKPTIDNMYKRQVYSVEYRFIEFNSIVFFVVVMCSKTKVPISLLFE